MKEKRKHRENTTKEDAFDSSVKVFFLTSKDATIRW